MFTSRAEHRLLLRIDNADLRLTPIGREAGLVDDERWAQLRGAAGRGSSGTRTPFGRTTVTVAGERIPAERALRQPAGRRPRRWSATASSLSTSPIRSLDFASLETGYRYEGYLRRQGESVERLKRQESRVDPGRTSSSRGFPGLSRESVERLSSVRPETLGQALRIPGLTRGGRRPGGCARLGASFPVDGCRAPDRLKPRIALFAAGRRTHAAVRCSPHLEARLGRATSSCSAALERQDQPDVADRHRTRRSTGCSLEPLAAAALHFPRSQRSSTSVRRRLPRHSAGAGARRAAAW